MPHGNERLQPVGRVVLISTVVVGALLGTHARPAGAAEPTPESALIGCERATERVVLTADAHLDPSCIYTEGFRIVASDVTLDCEGALIQKAGGGWGIEIAAPVDVDMTGVVVRDCHVDGFLNSIKITRDGFRDLPVGVEYENHLSGVVIEDNEVSNSHGVGIFVDGYVSDTVIRDNVVRGAGSTGIYLETGSRRTTVSDNRIVDNGYRENGPGGQLRTLAGTQFRFWGPGREGLAIDGSYENVVADNHFEGNAAGGVFLYKNCGEFPEAERYFERRFPSDDNVISDNTFVGGDHGVWVGQRMGENTFPMECTDDAYLTGPLLNLTLDYAKRNIVNDNRFVDVTYGVRVEDDGNWVVNNSFEGSGPDRHAVVVGTRVRTTELDHPVTDAFVVGNKSTIVDNPNPYRWVHGHDDLVVTGNTALGDPVGICEGEELPHLTMIWLLHAVVEPPGSPVTPTPPGLAMPTLGPLAACSVSSAPRIVPGSVSAVEGPDGEAVLPVALSTPADRSVWARWRTVTVPTLGDAAVDGADYVPTEGWVHFPVGETDAVVRIPLVDDGVTEDRELFIVAFGSPIDAHIGGFYGLGFAFVDDDD